MAWPPKFGFADKANDTRSIAHFVIRGARNIAKYMSKFAQSIQKCPYKPIFEVVLYSSFHGSIKA